MGTVAFSNIQSYAGVGGRNKMVRATLTMSNSYSAGGDTLPSPLGLPLDVVDDVLVGSAGDLSGHSRDINFDTTNKKFFAVVPSTQAEASGDLSTYKATVLIFGR